MWVNNCFYDFERNRLQLEKWRKKTYKKSKYFLCVANKKNVGKIHEFSPLLFLNSPRTNFE